MQIVHFWCQASNIFQIDFEDFKLIFKTFWNKSGIAIIGSYIEHLSNFEIIMHKKFLWKAKMGNFWKELNLAKWHAWFFIESFCQDFWCIHHIKTNSMYLNFCNFQLKMLQLTVKNETLWSHNLLLNNF